MPNLLNDTNPLNPRIGRRLPHFIQRMPFWCPRISLRSRVAKRFR